MFKKPYSLGSFVLANGSYVCLHFRLKVAHRAGNRRNDAMPTASKALAVPRRLDLHFQAGLLEAWL
jgi:hypothetical protein